MKIPRFLKEIQTNRAELYLPQNTSINGRIELSRHALACKTLNMLHEENFPTNKVAISPHVFFHMNHARLGTNLVRETTVLDF